MNILTSLFLGLASQTHIIGSETFLCDFHRVCDQAGECQQADERLNITYGYSLGSGSWATIAFSGAGSRLNAKVDRLQGIFSWRKDKKSHTIMFTPEASETIWIRTLSVEGGTEVFFGDCRNAF